MRSGGRFRWAAGYDGLGAIVGKKCGCWNERRAPFGLQQQSEQQEYHQHKTEALHHFGQVEVFGVAVFVILEGCSRDHVIGKRVGVLNNEPVFGDVVVPVGRLVEIQEHDRRKGDNDVKFIPFLVIHSLTCLKRVQN